MHEITVTIDGPAGSGKSTIAQGLAKRLGATFLDTGAMYRAVTLAAMRAKVDLKDKEAVVEVMDASNFEFKSSDGGLLVYLNGEDITEAIRDRLVTANAKYIAATEAIRTRLVQIQRQFAKSQRAVVTEGRDQGTVAFPNADYKFFLTADISERARRRHSQLLTKGIDSDLDQIEQSIKSRDKTDQNRAVGPLKPAADAMVIDTTDLCIYEVVEKLLGVIEADG